MSIYQVESLARLWGRAPEHGFSGAAGRIGAAIWQGAPQELAAPADPGIATVSLALTSHRTELFKDDRFAGNTRFAYDTGQIMPFGVAPRAVFRDAWRILHVYLPQTLIDAVASDLSVNGAVVLIDPLGEKDELLSSIMRLVASEVARPDICALAIDGLGAALASHLVRNWSSQRQMVRNHRQVSGGLAPRQMKRVADFLLANLAEDVGLAELAAIAGLSPHHFCRAFKHSTGLPPHAWLAAGRMERAKEMVAAHPGMGLIEVALCAGYSSQTTFGIAFKLAAGRTPEQWRRERIA
jgi:AraC family transcriptional regulator